MGYGQDAGEEIDSEDIDYVEAFEAVMPDTSEADRFRGRSYEEQESVAPGKLAFDLYSLVESGDLKISQARDIYEEVTSEEYGDQNERVSLERHVVPGERVALWVEDELGDRKLEEGVPEDTNYEF